MPFFVRDNLRFTICNYLSGNGVFSVNIKMDAFSDACLSSGEGG